MSDNDAAELSLLVSHEQLNNAFWRAIRMFVGRGKRHKAADVSIGAGVHRRTLDCYRQFEIGHPDHRPLDYDQKFSIASFIGADLTSQWIKFMGQTAHDLPDGGPGEGDYDDAALEATELVHEVQRARHPNSPGGTRIVQQEAEIITLKARKSAYSARKVA